MAEGEEVISCTKCGSTPEDVLILTCDHNLCLQCAAKNLRREQSKGNTSYQTIICDICSTPTALDPASASELLSNAFPTEENIESEPALEEEPKEPIQKEYEAMPKRDKVLLQSNHKEVSTFCKAHPDEEVKYFCFECLCAPMCSECVIYGVHKNHEVMHIKKAFPVIKERLEEVINKLATRTDDLAIIESKIEHKYTII